jgi:hypothetical protein
MMNSASTAAKFTKECTFKGQVFFYLYDRGFPHLSICLAEGFKELGIPFYSNINFWQISPDREDYLFRHDPSVTPEDCSVVVLDKDWNFYNQPFAENLFYPSRKYITVYLDDTDGSRPSLYPHISENFDFIFRTHCNSGTQYPDNYRPWTFEISNRILRETSAIPNFERRTRTLLANFRVSQDRLRISNRFMPVDQGWLQIEQGVILADYPLRLVVRDYFFPFIQEILPIDDTIDSFEHPPVDRYHYLQWKQTGSRHYPNYYERLKETAACAAFGGWLVPNSAIGKTFVEWWDSWRFWESLAAGCATFHVDLEKYGALLPVMPENWQHYIGIDIDNIQNAVERITSDPGILERISTEGRRWAIENYSPVATAVRFLKTIGCDGFPKSKQLEIPNNSATLQLWESVPDLLPVNIREINFIIFPDWTVPEELLCQELEGVIRAIATHPDQSKIALLVELGNISQKDADTVLSDIIFNLLMQEDLEISEELEISGVGKLDEMQWKALLNLIQGRIILNRENQQAIATVNAESLPSWKPESLSHKRAIQLETGIWVLRGDY